MKLSRLLYYTVIPIILSETACQKKPYIVPPASCDDKEKLSADFRIEESFANLNTAWPYYASDTVSVTLLKFTALDSLATSFEWHIGAGIYTTRSFQLEFPAAFLKQRDTISITLQVKGKPDTKCFPGDDSVKTITKPIYFTDSTLVDGKFNGYIEGNASDKYTIEINSRKPCSDIPGGSNNTANLSIFNLVKGCETIIGSCFGGQYKTAYKQVLFTSSTCQSPGGTIKIGADNNSITVDYMVYENGYQQPAVHKKFLGTRVR